MTEAFKMTGYIFILLHWVLVTIYKKLILHAYYNLNGNKLNLVLYLKSYHNGTLTQSRYI